MTTVQEIIFKNIYIFRYREKTSFISQKKHLEIIRDCFMEYYLVTME